MAFTLYTDRQKTFDCTVKLEIEGKTPNLSEALSRIVVEYGDFNLMFYGSMDETGKCLVPISKLKGLIPEGTEGDIKLEVISEEAYFSPWQDTFKVDRSKKIHVEIAGQEKQEETPIQEEKKKFKIEISDINIDEDVNHTHLLAGQIQKLGISYNMVKENKQEIYKIVKGYFTNLGIEADIKKEFRELMKNLRTK